MPLQIIRADITALHVDAIVCPTNRRLLPGSGIDYLVHRKAGRAFTSECFSIDGCEEGKAVVIGGYNLPARYVIMTVGPHWNGGKEGEVEVLESAYSSSLEWVRKLSLSSVAVPLISAGYYGVPDSLSLKCATDRIRHFLSSYDCDVYLVVFNRKAFDLSKGIFRIVSEFIGEEEVQRWEQGRGRAKCIPRNIHSRLYEVSRPYDEEEESDDSILKFQHMGMENESASSIASGKEDEAVASDGEDRKSVVLRSSHAIRPEDISIKCTDGFSPLLRRMVNEKFSKPSDCYKKANIDKKLFSKIMSDDNYRPSKDTVISFALALELDADAFSDMLGRAGFALSPADRKDLVIRYCIEHRFYDVLEINEILYALDLVPLGYRKI